MVIDLLRALHDNMIAEVFVAGESAWIQVSMQWTEAEMFIGTNSVLAVFQYGHVVLAR